MFSHQREQFIATHPHARDYLGKGPTAKLIRRRLIDMGLDLLSANSQPHLLGFLRQQQMHQRFLLGIAISTKQGSLQLKLRRIFFSLVSAAKGFNQETVDNLPTIMHFLQIGFGQCAKRG